MIPRRVHQQRDKVASKAAERQQRLAVAARKFVVAAIADALVDSKYDSKTMAWPEEEHENVLAIARDMRERIKNGLMR